MGVFNLRKCSLVSILLMLSLIAGSYQCASAKFLPRDKRLYSPVDYPEYENYFKAYQKQLEDAFTPEKFFTKRTDYAIQYVFKIRSDGSIVEEPQASWALCYPGYYSPGEYTHPIYHRLMQKNMPKFIEYVKEIIINNPPPPFPEGVDYLEFWIDVYFHYYPKLSKHNVESFKNDKKVIYHRQSTLGATKLYVPPQWIIIIYKGK